MNYFKRMDSSLNHCWNDVVERRNDESAYIYYVTLDASPSAILNVSPSVVLDDYPSITLDISPSITLEVSPSVILGVSPSVILEVSDRGSK